MSNQQKRNRLLILAIFGMSIIPFLIAWVLKENPELLEGRTNYGQLITPVITTERSDFAGFDQFTAQNMDQLPGHWLIVNVIPHDDCNEVCRDAMYKTKQLQLMMSKDLIRTRRVAMVFKDVAPEAAAEWWKDETRLLRVKPNEAVIKKIAAVRQDGVPDGMLLLMDPLGNVMMQYEPGFDPYKVKNDLMHLLKISQIG
ncbi:hypothetical protein V2P20_13575 [Methylobacter sp. Wu1]|uniref:hypothetical protein n=1 Tax=Methylobacter sp. Wu1 TaxID=3119359 RepID=UPI002F940771